MNFDLFNILIFAHVAICFVCILISIKSKMLRYLLPIIFFVPFLGIVLILAVNIGSKIGKQDLKFEVEEVFLESDKLEYISQIDGKKEMDIIPVEEALILNDNNVQRSVVMEIAKRDPVGYLKNLKRALLSEDTETAHYAASSITELKRGFDKELRLAQKAYDMDPSSAKDRRAFIEIMDQVLNADLIIDSIKQQHISTFIEVLIYDIESSKKPPHRSFQLLCEYLIKSEEFDKAQIWVDNYQTAYSRSDKPLCLQLEIAYEKKDTDLFEETMQEFEDASFPITQHSKRMIEFWTGDDSNGE